MKKLFTVFAVFALVFSIASSVHASSNKFLIEQIYPADLPNGLMGVYFLDLTGQHEIGVSYTAASITSEDTLRTLGINAIVSWANSTGGYTGITSSDVLNYKASLATVATSGLFSDIQSKPTTIAGYGITDAKRIETYSGTTSGSGTYTVTFGTAFSVAPNVQANIINGTDTQTIRITSVSTTGFTVLVRNRTDVVGLLPTYANVSGSAVDVLVTAK